MLWIGNGGASRNTQVRLTAVAPTILDLLEVAAPASMPGAPLIGNVT
jgi:bisphosphoglycerate-independent phosphoglycerate mutase (AlkP superfamily)